MYAAEHIFAHFAFGDALLIGHDCITLPKTPDNRTIESIAPLQKEKLIPVLDTSPFGEMHID
jgi:hypothetical protein